MRRHDTARPALAADLDPRRARAEAAFSGVVTALITPLRDGGLDEAAAVRLIEMQLAAGIRALLVGSRAAGESGTLTAEENRRMARLCIDVVGSSAAVIVDVSSNSTAKAMAQAREAEAAGAAYLLACSPWYSRPGQNGLVGHFEAVAAASSLPILVSNDPSRCCADIGEDALARIASLETVIGLVEGAPAVSRISVARSRCPADFRILAANDLTGLGALAHGAHGLISVTANVVPAAMAAFHAAWARGDAAGARRWDDDLRVLHRSLNDDPLPATAKTLLAYLAVCRPDVRLPITVSDDGARRAAVAALTAALRADQAVSLI